MSEQPSSSLPVSQVRGLADTTAQLAPAARFVVRHLRLFEVYVSNSFDDALPSAHTPVTTTGTRNNQHFVANSGSTKVSPALFEVREILRTEGFRGFYRGIAPEILKVTPMVAGTFSVYELLRRYMYDNPMMASSNRRRTES